MGPRVMRRPPKYVQGFIDRHGKPRYYLRRPGHKRMQLPGLPWSPIFMQAYEAAMEMAPRIEIGASRTRPGTVAAAVVSYFNSGKFQGHAPETRRTRKNILERFRAEHGDKRIALLQPEHVKSMMAAKAGKPQVANNFLKSIRALMQHCIESGMRTDDPTHGIKSAKVKTDGYRTWSEGDIEAFEAVHPVGSRARLALALLAVHRTAALRRRHIGAPARPERRPTSPPAEDRKIACDPRPSRVAGNSRRDTVRPPHIPDYSGWSAVLAGWLHELVPRQV
jgi:hypothetical protein